MERNGFISVSSNEKSPFFSRGMLSLSVSQHAVYKTLKKVVKVELWHVEA
jgi:hypothetical protein